LKNLKTTSHFLKSFKKKRIKDPPQPIPSPPFFQSPSISALRSEKREKKKKKKGPGRPRREEKEARRGGGGGEISPTE